VVTFLNVVVALAGVVGLAVLVLYFLGPRD
jgi:hypothetical protein